METYHIPRFPTHMNRERIVIEVAPAREARGGVSAMGLLSEEVLVERGWRVVRLETIPARNDAKSGLVESLAAARRVSKAIAQYPNAVVHIHGSQGGSLLRKGLVARAAHRRGNPVVFHVHGSHFDEWVKKRLLRRAWAGRVLQSWSDTVIALSNDWSRRIAAVAPRARIVVLANAVSRMEPSSGIGRETPVMVFAGHVGMRKGVDLLMQAVSALQAKGEPFELVIAGDGDLEWVRRAVERLPHPEACRVVGWLDSDELRAVYAQAAVLVLPSRQEGLPVVLLEAMSVGLACVVSDVGAMSEVVQDGVNGRVVRSEDVVALESALTEVLSDPAERRRLGRAARRTVVERYGSDAYGCALEEILLRSRESE